MLLIREFWRRHKRKFYVTLGAAGCGYLAYKLYDVHRHRILELERHIEASRENEERIKAQVQEHFEAIQRIGDTTTLPHALQLLSRRVNEELDLSALTEKLLMGKGQPSSLTSSEKLELWERLGILSFTRMVLSLWAMTVLTLYVRVLVNLLGRHLYVDTARGLESSHLLEEVSFIEREDEQRFLATAEFLPHYGLQGLISGVKAATTECLRSKQLRDIINATVFHEIVTQILGNFMSNDKPHHWVEYLMPEENTACGSSSSEPLPQVSKFDGLIMETRSVLSSPEFRTLAELSLKVVVDAVVEDVKNQPGPLNLQLGVPLAKFLPRVAHTSSLLLIEPMRDRFIKVIGDIPDVDLFFTLLYTNGPVFQQ